MAHLSDDLSERSLCLIGNFSERRLRVLQEAIHAARIHRCQWVVLEGALRTRVHTMREAW